MISTITNYDTTRKERNGLGTFVCNRRLLLYSICSEPQCLRVQSWLRSRQRD